MYKIGIIVNPEAGKDIRRLTGFAEHVDSNRMTNILTQFISAFLGPTKDVIFCIMPDINYTAERVISNLGKQLDSRIETLSINTTNSGQNTINSAKMLSVDFIFVLGGDGTNRLIFKTGKDLVSLPVFTGTNNVSPLKINAAIASIAAYIYLHNKKLIERRKVFEIKSGDQLYYSLIDIAIIKSKIIGIGAIFYWYFLGRYIF